MSPDPYLTAERQAERADIAQRWVDFIKAGLRGEVDLLDESATTICFRKDTP